MTYVVTVTMGESAPQARGAARGAARAVEASAKIVAYLGNIVLLSRDLPERVAQKCVTVAEYSRSEEKTVFALSKSYLNDANVCLGEDAIRDALDSKGMQVKDSTLIFSGTSVRLV